MSTCKACGAEILWTVTDKGKPMPIDPEPGKRGPKGEDPNIRKERLEVDEQGRKQKIVHVMKSSEYADNTKPLYLPHWVSCPNADEFRRSRSGTASRQSK